MPRFRASSSASSEPITRESVQRLAFEMMHPAHFFVAPDLALTWNHAASEELAWEVFRGHLLDPAHTRRRRTFEAWNVSAAGQPEALVALKLDAEAGELHVVRGLDSYVWEGYDAGGGVIESRERRKWVRELVATIRLDRLADVAELRDELACRLFQAVVGTSRLPLASVETPLPDFSFGRLFYSYRPAVEESAASPRSWRTLVADMLTAAPNPREQARLLETFLHAVPMAEMTEAAGVLFQRWREPGRTSADLSALLRTLFNEVSLSPYTDFVDRTLAFLRALEGERLFSTGEVVDFLSFLLRHVSRHLTAYDLVVFHHRGANYPDALLLDAVLKEYLALVERRPELFTETPDDRADAQRRKRIRRRALRQGWLLRRRYEGHAVPDAPTSPGENRRVLPGGHPRVPEEQITQPARRTRQLYLEDPLAARPGTRAHSLLRQSVADLDHADEWRELGLAIFLDRPLGDGKAATEPDGTLLVSAEAFSASIARERLNALAGEVGLRPDDAELQRLLVHPPIPGLPLDAVGAAPRPGTVSLTDARRASADFLFLRTTPGSARAFLSQFDFAPLRQRFQLEDVLDGAGLLLARSAAGGTLVLHDAQLRPRVELVVDMSAGYDSRAGEEVPAAGLLVQRVWETTKAHDLRATPLRLMPNRRPAGLSAPALGEI